MTIQPPVKVFLSYAHDDEENGQWCSEFIEHLSAMGERWDNAIDLWFDGRIEAGVDWRKEIDKHLQNMKLFIFLHSSSFTNSPDCTREYEFAEQKISQGVRIIMVRLRPALVPEKLCKWQWLPQGDLTITCCRNKDKVFETVASEIKAVVQKIFIP